MLAMLLALPAVQVHACTTMSEPAHSAMAAMSSMAEHDHVPAPLAPLADGHDCLGCIAPINVSFYQPVDAPRVMARRKSGPAGTPTLLTHRAAPEPPPPRTAV
jgi:hypothetical protein